MLDDKKRMQIVLKMAKDRDFYGLSNIWIRECIRHNYSYIFTWLGRPIIQLPQDIYAVQELIWSVKPDIIIETGVAHGGSLILSASILALLDIEDNIKKNKSEATTILPTNRKVIGIDVEIRSNNKKALEEHFLFHMIEIIEGSSTDKNIINKVHNICLNYKKPMVFLDSNHTHEHVLNELLAYAPCVAEDSYCVVWDTGIEELPEDFFPNRPWGKGNNPMTAVKSFLKLVEENQVVSKNGIPMKFEIDNLMHQNL